MWPNRFFKSNAHAEARTDVHNAATAFEGFLTTVQHDADEFPLGDRIESVDVASGATDITCASGEAGVAFYFLQNGRQNQREAGRITAIGHNVRHFQFSLYCPETLKLANHFG